MPEERCVYLGKENGQRYKQSIVYKCQRFNRCVLDGKHERIPVCDQCRHYLAITKSTFSRDWVDHLSILDRCREKTESLRGMLAGKPAFLVCSGPSAESLPLWELNKRGCFSMAVNNAACLQNLRPQAFVCADPPRKFHHSIWDDPGVMKFIPTNKMIGGTRGELRQKMLDGSFRSRNHRVIDCSNVWGFVRHTHFTPTDDFFLTEGAMWGNLSSGVERTGLDKTVCTMLLGIRLLRYLGAGRIYLVGVDFWMSLSHKYAFDQDRTVEAIATNNDQFSIVNKWLCKMEEDGVFERFGVRLYNCYERSGLRAFPYVPFHCATEEARGICEDEPDLSGWYD